jgi:AcrR family transcriptional regulator
MPRAGSSQLAKGGRREQNKRDKILRIKQAAAELFTIKGFDAATTEAIAKRARVAKGTLFLYARDKRDLVFLIFDDEITKIAKKAFAQANPEEPVLDQLVAVATGLYKGFAKNLQLSRILLAELFFYRGKLAKEFYEDRQRVIERYERLLSRARSSGKLASDVDTAVAAKHVFILISGSLRIWLGEERPHLARGIQELRQILCLSIRNIGPLPVPPEGDRER